ncbi:MAG: DUF1801 domain-containing protein [Bacteroidales bacterium]|jgi:uncharacterized protein YdhG (YjbR/CyaY superfamily)|nr:DUF1801 domain-containing protein [Bacteroidales bacterium]MDI9533446.1 DUF1801 domain-containing protein [Bacteroidota bacterium]MDX9904301.1 DUF1801 domain-containing protein [Bacteroidales bacterium]HNX85004.1 DUF1801 domain-containing protein [Bacteroidales bacterium]HOC48956.1 DUF1801 domain-containing protein [Bacteroidales bacterium]
MNTKAPSNIDDYISLQAPEVQPLLKKVRETILDAAPGAEEYISYMMPSFRYNGKILVYFAAHKNHLGFYATPSGNIAFSEELKDYKSSKGAVQFPLDRPIPYDLIRRMVQYKLEEIMASSTKKRI